MAAPKTILRSDFEGAVTEPPSGWLSGTGLSGTTDNLKTNGSGLCIHGSGGYRSKGRLNVTFRENQEVWVEIDTPAADDWGLECRIQNGGTGTGRSYVLYCDATTPGWYNIQRYSGGTFAANIATLSTGPTQQAGDIFLLRAVGSTISAYHYRAGVETLLMSVTDTTITGTGQIGLNTGSSGNGTPFRNFGGGSVVSFPSVGSLSQNVRDNFNRANAANLGGNWSAISDWGSNRIAILGNTADTTANAPEGDIWTPLKFGPDQEVSVTLARINYDSSHVWLFLQVPSTTGGFTGYLCDVITEFAQLSCTVFRGNAGSYTNLGSGNSAWGGGANGVGDVITARKVGNVISILRNGVVFAGPFTDPAPLSAIDTYVGLGMNGSVGVEDFTVPVFNPTLIDNFDRASLGANWTNGIYSGEQLQISFSDYLTNVSGWGSASYNVATYGPDIEHIALIQAAGTFEIGWKLANVATASPNGYFIHYENSGTPNIQLWKMVSGTQSSIGATQAITFNGGDKIGIQQIGDVIQVYRQPVNTEYWVLVMSRIDSTYNAVSGRLGYLINGAGIDEMYGGTASAGGILTPISLPAGLTLTAALSSRLIHPKAVPAALTLTPALTKLVKDYRTLPATLTMTAALVRTAKKFTTLPATVTLTAAMNRRLGKPVAVTLATNPVMAFAKSKFLTMPATVTMGITLSRTGKYYKTLTAGVTLTPAIARKQMLNKTLAASVSLAAQTQLIRIGRISLAGNLPLTGIVAKRGNKLLNSVVSFAGAIQVQKISGGAILRTLAAGLQLQSGLVASKVIKKTLTGALFLDSIIQRRKHSPEDWPGNDWLIDAKSLDTPQLDSARLDEAVLERTVL